jgi:hypothetical protein
LELSIEELTFLREIARAVGGYGVLKFATKVRASLERDSFSILA